MLAEVHVKMINTIALTEGIHSSVLRIQIQAARAAAVVVPVVVEVREGGNAPHARGQWSKIEIIVDLTVNYR
jgi:hypothetical protein